MLYVGNSNPYENRPFVPYSNSYQGPSYSNNYQNNNNTPQQATQIQQRQLPDSRQQLQITSGNANQSPGQPFRPQPNQPNNNPNAQGFNQNPFRPARPYSTRAYYTTDKGDRPLIQADDQAQYE